MNPGKMSLAAIGTILFLLYASYQLGSFEANMLHFRHCMHQTHDADLCRGYMDEVRNAD